MSRTVSLEEFCQWRIVSLDKRLIELGKEIGHESPVYRYLEGKRDAFFIVASELAAREREAKVYRSDCV